MPDKLRGEERMEYIRDRMAQGVTQAAIARELNVSPARITQLLIPQRTNPKVNRPARLFRISMMVFRRYEGRMTNAR